MSKYNDYLTEVAFQIDDLIYEFYHKTNELVAGKRNQEELLEYRDETISIVNDMNVRALEKIASFSKDSIVEERAEILLQKNRDILDQSLNVLETSPNKGEIFEEVKSAAADALSFTNKKVEEFQESDTYANIKEQTAKGYNRLKAAFNKFKSDPKVKEGFETAKGVTKDIAKKGGELIHKGSDQVKTWYDSTKEEAEDLKDKFEDDLDEVKDKFEDEFEDIKESFEDTKDDAEDLAEDLIKEAEDKVNETRRMVEEVLEDLEEGSE